MKEFKRFENNAALMNVLTRRSVRAFKQEQITDEELDAILTAAVYAPTAMNRQTSKFTVLQGEKLEKLVSAITAAVLDGEIAFSRQIDAGYRCNYNAPTLIIASDVRENPLGYANCACALENMFLAANALGIGSCWINQVKPACEAPSVRALLTSFGVPADHVCYGSAALGYPASQMPDAPARVDGRVIR